MSLSKHGTTTRRSLLSLAEQTLKTSRSSKQPSYPKLVKLWTPSCLRSTSHQLDTWTIRRFLKNWSSKRNMPKLMLLEKRWNIWTADFKRSSMLKERRNWFLICPKLWTGKLLKETPLRRNFWINATRRRLRERMKLSSKCFQLNAYLIWAFQTEQEIRQRPKRNGAKTRSCCCPAWQVVWEDDQ